MKFEENLNDSFLIFRNEKLDLKECGYFMVRPLKTVEVVSILGLIFGLTTNDDATDSNSLFLLDIINIENEDYLITSIKKEESPTGKIDYFLSVVKRESFSANGSPFSKLKHMDQINPILEKIIYERHTGSSEHFNEIREIAYRSFSLGLNLSTVRAMKDFDADNIKVNENGELSIGI